MKLLVIIKTVIISSLLSLNTIAQNTKEVKIETRDIETFWKAYDGLKFVHTKTDSLNIITHQYFDQLTTGGKKFILGRKRTANQYLDVINAYPKYFASLRIKTSKISNYFPKIEADFKVLKTSIPHFKTSDVYFTIGCLDAGSMVSNRGDVLIGAEVMLVDTASDLSEFTGNRLVLLKSISIPITTAIVLESINRQAGLYIHNMTVLNCCLNAGAPDFLLELIFKKNGLKEISNYGLLHECELWRDFSQDINSGNRSKWIYNLYQHDSDKPDNIGFFIGKRICESYYNKQADKSKAIVNLLHQRKYSEILKKSGYNGSCNTISSTN